MNENIDNSTELNEDSEPEIWLLDIDKKRGRPREFKTNTKMWDSFNGYINECLTDNETYALKEMIKAGQKAGELVKVGYFVTPTIEGFCNYLGITTQCFDNYRRAAGYESFFGVSARIVETIRSIQIQQALHGQVDSSLVGMLNNIKQRQDITTNDNEIQIAQIKFSSE